MCFNDPFFTKKTFSGDGVLSDVSDERLVISEETGDRVKTNWT